MVKRLTWKWLDKQKKCLDCYNDKDEHLGFLQLEKVGAHMHWCWNQYEGYRMSPGCLEEVREKQKELLNARNNTKVDPNVIHKTVYHQTETEKVPFSSVLRRKRLYLCNQATKTTPDKLSIHWHKVTCKNCLKHKPK